MSLKKNLPIRKLIKNLIIGSNNLEISKNFELNKLKKLVIESRIESIFLELAKNNFIWEKKDKPILEKIQSSSFSRFVKTTENLRYLKVATREFNRQGINFLILKGGYLTTNVYKKISHRPINDIDIFIDHAQNNSAIKALENIGLKTRKGINTSDSHIMPMENFNRSVRFDIHNHLFKNDFDKKSHFENKREVNIFNESMFIPENELFLLHLIEHGTSKGNFDVGIQFIFDIYYFLNNCKLDLTRLDELSKRYGLSKELEISNALIKNFFGINFLKEINVSKEVINACEDIIFGPFIHNKTTNLLQSNKFAEELNSIKLFKKREKNIFLKGYEATKRYSVLISKYLASILNLIFKNEYKDVLKAKIIINRYFND